MGAIFFYIFIYFLGYYGSNILNMFTVRPLITNRFIAALIPVFCIALLHGYMIVTKPPPASQDITVESALFTYVAMPVVIVTLGAVYFMWNARRSEEEEAEEPPAELRRTRKMMMTRVLKMNRKHPAHQLLIKQRQMRMKREIKMLD